MSTQTFQMVNLSVSDLTELIKNAISTEIQKVVSLATQPQKIETEILTREEVKDLLKISYTSLWKYNKQKTLIARKANGKVFYMRSDVMNLLNNVA
ncbi:DNA-binding protein [Flavobacterium sp. RSP15]|uniref:DNA-binding protein n=1 Tax=Flavobacterium sp. RSP15 TaxID=2497485 RepID=UPI000F83A0FB|nr:DNA-binding protein [Flavobacterium sp. RSP15]RTY86337.1 DNA-binding protein [Flavobacterium sp. RSP15]